MAYQIEFVSAYRDDKDYGCQALIAMLTGYEMEEVVQRFPKTSGWYGREFIEAFQKLGFNTTKFIRFDEASEYPALMRFNWQEGKRKYWSVEAYNNGFVYDPYEGITALDDWKFNYSACRITTMVQVWI